jgi:cell pole-organizing protein PopZ
MIMGDLSNEPSMEEILASIRRIISEEGEAAVPTPKARASRAVREQPVEAEEATEDAPDILELTEPMAVVDEPSPGDALMSDEAAAASRRSLAALAMTVTQPGPSGHSQIEDLVRELLRPMLKEWLDANLPAIVDAKVAAEIARVTGRR